MLKPEDIDDEWVQQLIAESFPVPKPKPKPTVESNVVTLPPKAETPAERYRAMAEHNRALMRVLRQERNASYEADCANQLRIDRCWETAVATQAELDALYAFSCVRGPFERF